MLAETDQAPDRVSISDSLCDWAADCESQVTLPDSLRLLVPVSVSVLDVVAASPESEARTVIVCCTESEALSC
jgi:hypothetical protein